MELPKGQGQTSRREYWRSHVESAEKFSGSNKQYCEEQGLHYGNFNAYRNRLGYSNPRKAKLKSPSIFAKVQIEPTQATESQGGLLPDPAWLAEFLINWKKLSCGQ